MAVNTWERELSDVAFLYQTYKMNEYIAHVLSNLPVKYKDSYDKYVITVGLQTFETLYKANSIMINEFTSDFDYKERKKYLREGLAQLQVCMAAFHIYMNRVRNADGINEEKIDKVLAKISEFGANIKSMTLNVIKSDEKRQREYKTRKLQK